MTVRQLIPWRSNGIMMCPDKEHIVPQQIKPTPERCCEFCGARLERKRFSNGVLESLLHFGRRKFCGRVCMAKAFDQRHTGTSWGAEHKEARQAVGPGPCERCGRPNALDVHHRNEDWHDNRPENLERICRSCHNLAHGRRKPCSVCGLPQKGLGYCAKHYQRFKTTGSPLGVKAPRKKPCGHPDCNRTANAKGLCGMHYMRQKRGGILP